MSNKNDRALIPGSAHLPAVIEQRTRIINQVMGELTSRDTEAFFRRHPEVSTGGVGVLPVERALIERFADRWNWDRLSLNQALPWSEALIERFADRWDTRAVSRHYDGNVRSLTLEQVERL